MKKIIFISSSGRSGSKSLAYAINTVNGVKSFHCPYGLEDYKCNTYLKDLKRVKIERKKLIESVHSSGCHFVESGVCLRYCFEDIVETYPECIIVHLVRDGRNFVRSGFNRPWFKKHKNRFNKICKHWSEGQIQMIEGMEKIPEKNRGGVVKHEDLIKGDIRWFLERIGLKSTKKIILPVLNVTKTAHKLFMWNNWDQELVNKSKIYMGKELEYFEYR